MKKTIKIAFHSAVSKATMQQVIGRLKSNFNPIVSKDYDYYFAMETIYWNKKNWEELLVSDKRAIRIMLCGEAVYPDLNLFDYVSWHFDCLDAQDRILQVPLLELEKPALFDSISELDNSKLGIDPEKILYEKTKFCNFIYANPNAHEMRDAVFFALSQYKKVDSLGAHLKNTEIEDTRMAVGWEKISIELKKPYKFSIAAENAKFPGYTSEKLMTSMMANTIPIYWGDPEVAIAYNTKSFVNVSDFDFLDDLVERVMEIDQNDELYCEIMEQPWRTSEQIIECNEKIESYSKAFNNIFAQDKETARRRPEGCWPEIYSNFFLQAENSSVLKFLKKKKS